MKKNLIIISLLMFVLCAFNFTSPAYSLEVNMVNGKKVVKWKANTLWPPSINLIDADVYMANLINKLSNGRLIVELNPAGSIVSTKEVFDAVRTGTLDASSDYPGYWAGKNMPALDFYYSFAMGMTPVDMDMWFYHGGGKELLSEIYGKHGLVPLLNSATGMESGFRSNRPLKTAEDFKGLKVRMGTRPAQYVVKKLGGLPMLLAGGEVYTALERGTIDAAEFSVPSTDWKMGLQEVTKYQCLPGWYQVMYGGGWIINKKAWDALDEDLKLLVETAARLTYFWSYTKVSYESIEAQKNFIEHGTIITTLDEPTMDLIEKYINEYVETWSKKDPMFKKVAQSYFQFFKDFKYIRDMEEARSLGFGHTPKTYPNIFN